MRFYSKEKELSVFNRRKKIANFENGEFDTEDEDVIRKLKPHFKYESPKIISGLASFLKLKKEAKEKGINTYKLKKHEIEEILKNLK